MNLILILIHEIRHRTANTFWWLKDRPKNVYGFLYSVTTGGMSTVYIYDQIHICGC